MTDKFKANALRIIDANANRAREGLRVSEDFVRFVLEDFELAKNIRELRHRITSALKNIAELTELLATRDTPHDPGASPEKFKPSSPTETIDIAVSAFKRTQEATRSLAEYSKPIDAAASAEFEFVRYAAYELEKQAILAASNI